MPLTRHLFAELMWLGAAALLAWFAPKTFLAIEALAAAITLTLMQVERHFR